MARALMFQGTGSDVGKTVLVAGLCRVAKRRGIRVMPFKPQNMSNNAAVADPDEDGASGEMGRAQWLQALACGVAPSVHMNPVLLKPQSQVGSQVVVQGKVRGAAKAREYQAMKPDLLDAVMESFEIIKSRAELVLVEGAGSPAEINLRAGDIANMGFATKANVPVVLVGDIDRGGVIASIVGTHTILPEDDRQMIAGYLINKFRGDVSLFDDGLAQITGFTGWRSFGVLPWQPAVSRLPAEDSVALDHLVTGDQPDVVMTIAVPVMGKIANFDDLDPLRQTPGVQVIMVRAGERLPTEADLVLLPGSKSTISDLMEFRRNGWDHDLENHTERGGQVFGICGGYQMLGKRITDPLGIEGDTREIAGLGLLDVETELQPEKIVRNSVSRSIEHGVPLEGYEIHMGRTQGVDCVRPVVDFGTHVDGAVSPNGLARGCYLHGLFGSDEYRAAFLSGFGVTALNVSYRHQVETALDELADAMEARLDVEALLETALQQ